MQVAMVGRLAPLANGLWMATVEVRGQTVAFATGDQETVLGQLREVGVTRVLRASSSSVSIRRRCGSELGQSALPRQDPTGTDPKYPREDDQGG